MQYAMLATRSILLLLLLFGVVANTYVFFLPHNLIADEEGYLGQLLAVIQGWEVQGGYRTYVYPLLLPLGLLPVKLLGFDSVSELVLGARILNWITLWVALALTFFIARHLFDVKTGLVSVVLLVFCWYWTLSGRSMMMDVPSSMWLWASFYFVVLGVRRVRNIVLAVLCGSIAFFTKFQTAPALAVIGLLLVLSPAARGVRERNLLLALLSAGSASALWGAIDWATHGVPFGSLIEFAGYNFGNQEAFIEKYGPCKPINFYLLSVPHIFSYLFPVVLIVGIYPVVKRPSGAVSMLLVVLAYVLVLHLLCHKQLRYLITVLPMLIIIGASGIVWLGEQSEWLAKHLQIRVPAIESVTVLTLVMLSIISFAPRHHLAQMWAREDSCMEFVAAIKPQFAKWAGDDKIALVAGCNLPKGTLRGYDLSYVNKGIDEYTRERARTRFLAEVDNYGVIVTAHGDEYHSLVTEKMTQAFCVVAQSPHGEYLVHARVPAVGESGMAPVNDERPDNAHDRAN